MELAVVLDPDAYRVAEALAAERHLSISKVVSDAVLRQRTETTVVKGALGLPEITFPRPLTDEDIRAAIEEED
ncbi:hypothetical protein EON81_15090 [bacterium]|nr:MAG: hypothetical protein EON81_15090 [bacterium]